MLQALKVSKSIIKTLSYSDIFEFPLTRNEIYKYYIGDRVEKKQIYSVLEEMAKSGIIDKKSNFYFLRGKADNYSKRMKRKYESRRKMLIAENYIKLLSVIPTIKLIGISGSLSMNNCDRRDDIDLFFITSKNSLWFTRLAVNLLLLIKGVKRARGDSFGIDRICPNMFLAENDLSIDKNLFTAHEISQLKVVMDKDNIYCKFLNKNSWVLKFMPNSFDKNLINNKIQSGFNKRESGIFKAINKLFYNVQYFYMKKRITIENVSFNRAAFHPKDKTYFVLDLYINKYKSYQKAVFSVKNGQPQNAFSLASDYTPGY